MTQFDDYVRSQAERQASGHAREPMVPLNFASFAFIINGMGQARRDELDTLLLSATVSEIQTMLTRGKTTSVELVAYYVGRMQQLESFHTMIVLNPEALAIAAALDAERAAGIIRGSLHGIPVTLKANIATGDLMPTHAGAAALQHARADADAYLVTQLRQAGLIILGKNNLSEWANFYSATSVNGFSALGSYTRNPYGAFDVGGSSSGSCAAVSLHLTPLSIGSETTGSITYPASQNYVVGMKPSVGLISRDRIIPITDAFDTAGPIGRRVADVAALMTVLAQTQDLSDPASVDVIPLIGLDFSVGLDADALRGVRVGVVVRAEPLRTGDDALRVLLVERLTEADAIVVDIPPMSEVAGKDHDEQLGKDSFLVLLMGFRLGVEAYLQGQGGRVPVHTLTELVAFNLENIEERVPLGQNLIEQAANLTDTELEGYSALADQTRAEYARLIREALAAHNVAVMVDFANYASPYHSRAGFPALTVPLGFRETGEPFGATFFGDRLSDAQLLRYGYAFEQTGVIEQAEDE